MNKSILKFINFLSDFKKELKSGIIEGLFKNQGKSIFVTPEVSYTLKLRSSGTKSVKVSEIITETERLTELLTTPREKWSEKNEIFVDFKILSHYLLSSPLTDREKYQVVMYLIEKNIGSGILHEVCVTFDGRKIIDYPFETISGREIVDMLYYGNICDFLNREKGNCTELELRQKEEFLANKDKFTSDISETASCNKVIYERLVKKSNPSLNDIVVCIEILRELQIIEPVVESIKTYLIKNNEKKIGNSQTAFEIAEDIACLRLLGESEETITKFKESIKSQNNKLTPKNQTSNEFTEESKTTKKYINDKEYRAIRNEIRKVYDSYNMKLLKVVTYEEMLHIVSLMLQLEMNIYEIQRFISLAYREMEDYVESYEETIARLAFYFEAEQLESINAYYEEMQSSNEDDYEFWKHEYEKELQILNSKIPDNYKYEVSLALKSNN